MNILILLDSSGTHGVFLQDEMNTGTRIGQIKDKPEIWTGTGTPDTSRIYFQRGYLISKAEQIARRYARKHGEGEMMVLNFEFYYPDEQTRSIYSKEPILKPSEQ